MASGSEPINDDGNFQKLHHLSLTVGSENEDDEEEEKFDIQKRMPNFAKGDDNAMSPTIFHDDTEFIHPSTSSTFANSNFVSDLLNKNDLSIDVTNSNKMDSFVKKFFNTDSVFQPLEEGNFVEEVFTEKLPKIINNYLFGNVIGEGSYSKVKEILHTKSIMRRAVKIIKDKRLRKIPGGERNVQREIEMIKRICHENVVEIFDVFRIEEKQKLYIIMEYCVCSLQQLLDNCIEKRLSEFQAQIYFIQILDGLDYLHQQRIIHKDIKPGNLLLSLDGRIKICDFGVAEELSGENEDWCTIAQGTPKFQPPEVVSGTEKKFRGRPVDIWASGVTLYHIVSGEYPFEGDVIMILFENITTLQFEMPSNVMLSKSLQKLLRGLLEKNPIQRWTSSDIRKSEWFINKLPIIDSKIVQVPQMGRFPSHRPLSVFYALEQLYDPAYHLTCESIVIHDDVEVLTNNDQIKNTNITNCQASDLASKLENKNTTFEINNTANSVKTGSKFLKFFRRKNFTKFFNRLIS